MIRFLYCPPSTIRIRSCTVPVGRLPRPSYYRCRCKNDMNNSELTIADFWEVNQLMPDFDDDKGVGPARVNTDKRKTVFTRLCMEIKPST